MSDNPTRETPDSRSFEERVFARFDSLDTRIDRIEVKVDALDARLSRVETKVDALDGRLTALEEKVDSRLRETRPIWEAMQADLATVKEDVSTVKSDVRDIKRGLKILNNEILQDRIKQDELDERVEKLESQRTP